VCVLHGSCLPGFPDNAFGINPETGLLAGLPRISETQILSYMRHFSQDIGFRAAEHAVADEWMVDMAYEAQSLRITCHHVTC
jgi:hypothetical protein